MKEYCIYIKQGSGTPYFCYTKHNNIIEAKNELYDIVQIEEERGRPYYVDNDFFNNKYNQVMNLKYLCIKEREVTEWSNFSEEKYIRENDNKIIYIKNFIK